MPIDPIQQSLQLISLRSADWRSVRGKRGRQLDGAMASLTALPDVRQTSGAMTIMLDSGVRRGTDVLKAIALGAAGVFVGRPFLFAAAYAGEAGVRHAISLLLTEIDKDMALLGLRSIKDVSEEMIVPVSPQESAKSHQAA